MLGVATEPTDISSLATLCPGCHNHPSLRLPWAYLPEKVAADIERFIDQLHSLYHKSIIDQRLYDKMYEHASNC